MVQTFWGKVSCLRPEICLRQSFEWHFLRLCECLKTESIFWGRLNLQGQVSYMRLCELFKTKSNIYDNLWQRVIQQYLSLWEAVMLSGYHEQKIWDRGRLQYYHGIISKIFEAVGGYNIIRNIMNKIFKDVGGCNIIMVLWTKYLRMWEAAILSEISWAK